MHAYPSVEPADLVTCWPSSQASSGGVGSEHRVTQNRAGLEDVVSADRRGHPRPFQTFEHDGLDSGQDEATFAVGDLLGIGSDRL